jgi:hypothetical protein
LLEGDLLGAAIRCSQVDDLCSGGCHACLPQACAQASVSLRVCPATDDDTPRLNGCKCLNQGLRGFADLGKQQRGHSGQLAAQLGGELPEAKRHRPGTDITTDDDDRRLPRRHQPMSATAK